MLGTAAIMAPILDKPSLSTLLLYPLQVDTVDVVKELAAVPHKLISRLLTDVSRLGQSGAELHAAVARQSLPDALAAVRNVLHIGGSMLELPQAPSTLATSTWMLSVLVRHPSHRVCAVSIGA
jgi:hypothetical protein